MRAPAMMANPYRPEKDAKAFLIEKIEVNMEKLETDEDYDEIARKVGERIYSGMMKGAPVGGLR